MNKNEIFETLEENDLDNIEEIDKGPGVFVVKCSYIFDDPELEGAEDYAREECGELKNEKWYEEFFLPYLNDMAMDNVNDIIDDISEDYEVDYEMMSFELSEDNYHEMKFLVAFYHDKLPFDIDDLIGELE